jgi:hypothetical protein
MRRGTVLLGVVWLLVAAPAAAQEWSSAAIAVTVLGGALGASVAVGSVVTMVGGARDLHLGRATRGWRVANYVLGVLDILAGIPLCAVYVSTHWVGEPAMGIPLITVGVADLGIAISSSWRARSVAVAIAPALGREGGGAYGGVSLAMRF